MTSQGVHKSETVFPEVGNDNIVNSTGNTGKTLSEMGEKVIPMWCFASPMPKKCSTSALNLKNIWNYVPEKFVTHYPL